MKQLISIVIFILGLCSCDIETDTEKIIEASIESISHAPDTIHIIESIADCTGPKGDYLTEVHSGPDHYMYFKQTFSYKSQPFEAVVYNDNLAFTILNRVTVDTLDNKTIQMLKGHDFLMNLIQVNKRFHDFSEPYSVSEPRPMWMIKAKDARGAPVVLYFDRQQSTLDRLSLQNPDNNHEQIDIHFLQRRLINDLVLPMHIEIYQGEKKFTFDYRVIKINPPDFRVFK